MCMQVHAARAGGTRVEDQRLILYSRLAGVLLTGLAPGLLPVHNETGWRNAAMDPGEIQMGTRQRLDEECRALGVLALYLFGSRAADGLRVLRGEEVDRAGSDLDIGVVFLGRDANIANLPSLQVVLEDAFAPLRVDLVPLQRVDALFQFAAVDGERLFAGDEYQADLYELVVMRKAAELLPIQRAIERDLFGVSTS
jgi:predicted nucleotidyltransferase